VRTAAVSICLLALLIVVPEASAAERGVLASENLRVPRQAGELLIEIDGDTRRRMIDAGRGIVRDFPLPGDATVDLDLEAFDIIAPHARFVVVDEDGERELPPPPVNAFRGTVIGDPDSIVSLIFLGDRMAGSIRTWDKEFTIAPENYNRARAGSWRMKVRERRPNEDGPAHFECGGALVPGPATWNTLSNSSQATQASSNGAIDLQLTPNNAGADQPATEVDGGTLLQATIAVDATVEFYQHFGSLSATQDYILNLLAQVSTIYESEVLVKLQVGYLRVFTAEPDPYTDGSTSTSVLLDDMLDEWRANKSDVERTVAHLFSRRASGGSGLAYVDVLCNENYGYGVSTFPGDGASWEVRLTAHELGHNFSSPHTHCYTPEIDFCANQDGCYQGEIIQSVSTIMSYCNQKQSVFHQRVKDEKIRPAAENAYPFCVTTAGLPGSIDDGSGSALEISKPPACPSATLSNDDGSLNGYFGYYGTAQTAWIKRFTPACYPFMLDTAEVIIGHTSSISPGRPIRVLVYVDPSGSGDPAYATLAYSADTTVQVVSAFSYNSYDLSEPVMINSGDYYIGFYDLEADAGDTYPASRDSSREGDSWLTANSTSPDDFNLHTGATWMIRGLGGAVSPGTLQMTWQPACNEGSTPDQDYAVYEGSIGAFASKSSLTCSTSRATSWLTDAVADDTFLIVVPQTAANEGSYGLDGYHSERAPAQSPCHPQEIGTCP
jgi:hypothetical protein